jgi:hypothetical protein
VAAITTPWRRVLLYENSWTWIPAAALFLAGVALYKFSHHQFTLSQLGGLPEVPHEHGRQRLATAGIRSRVRHPFISDISAKCSPGA